MKLKKMAVSVFVFFSLAALPSFVFAERFAFSVNTDDGVLTTESVAGQVVYIDFWASWCVPCRKSFPWMNDMQAKYQDQGLKIVAINLDKKKALAQEFLEKFPADFIIGYDPAGELAEKFGVIGMPMAFLINRQGEVIAKHTGFKTSKETVYEHTIMQALVETHESENDGDTQ